MMPQSTGDFNSAANLIIEPSMQAHGHPVSQQYIAGRKLLVIDDLWNVQYTPWKNFISTLESDTILLITTRDPNIASITDTNPYHINRLCDTVCTEVIMKMLPKPRLITTEKITRVITTFTSLLVGSRKI